MSQSLSATVDEWLTRRKLLDQAGIETPTLFGRNGATLLEEFIEHTLVERLAQIADSPACVELAAELGRSCRLVADLGFPCLSLHDLRSRGDDVVFVDFGQDLGPAGILPNGHAALLDQACEVLERANAASQAALRSLSGGFEHGDNI